jgi:hypothetical protein
VQEVKEAQKNVATHEELLAETERRAAAFEVSRARATLIKR